MHAAKTLFDLKSFLAIVRDRRTIHKFTNKQTIFSQGDPAESVYYLQRGKVKLSVLSARGKEAVLAVLESSAFFGEGCLAGQPLRMAGATTLTECSVIEVTKQAMVSLLHDHTSFAEMFIAYLLSRNIRIEEDLVDQLFNTSEKRLARLLLLLANFGKEAQPEAVMSPISHQTLGEMIGTTRSRVSFFMNRFRKLGFIEYNGHLSVHPSLLTVVLHDKPGLAIPFEDGTERTAASIRRRSS